MKLTIDNGAFDGESVVNVWDEDGRPIGCTVSVFLRRDRTGSKTYGCGSKKARLRTAYIIQAVADKESWSGGIGTVSGALESWADEELRSQGITKKDN